MRCAVLVFVVVVSALGARAQQSKFLDYRHRFEGTRIVGNGVFDDPPPSFAELAVLGAQARAPEDVLDILLARAPKLRANYVLVHESQSQQLASIERPRVIFFGGGRAYAFSDDPDQAPRVEVMETEPGTYKVHFAEATFPGGVARFDSQPRACAACHGENGRPLWNPYDFWPNAFFSAIGFIGTKQELDAYGRLRANAAASPILSRLSLPELRGRDDASFESTTAFTQFVAQIGFGRWVGQTLGSSAESSLRAYVKPLLASLSLCPVDASGGLEANPRYAAIKADIEAARAAFKSSLDATLERLFPTPQRIFRMDHSRLASETDVLAQFRWILERAGVDGGDLSSSLFGNDVLLSTPSNWSADLLATLYELRPDLFVGAPLLPHESGAWILADCKAIGSLADPAPLNPPSAVPYVSFRSVQESRPALSRCAKCHVEGMPKADGVVAPQIPFDRPRELARRLRDQPAYRDLLLRRIAARDESQMPPGRALTPREAEAFAGYLETLSERR